MTSRLGEQHYLMSTTTGGAARVLNWMERWLQTEWPELDVHCTSVTEQWSTIAVVGPKSREVIAEVAPELAANGGLDAEAFPFMTFRETTLASGVRARICRMICSTSTASTGMRRLWRSPGSPSRGSAAKEPRTRRPRGSERPRLRAGSGG